MSPRFALCALTTIVILSSTAAMAETGLSDFSRWRPTELDKPVSDSHPLIKKMKAENDEARWKQVRDLEKNQRRERARKAAHARQMAPWGVLLVGIWLAVVRCENWPGRAVVLAIAVSIAACMYSVANSREEAARTEVPQRLIPLR